MNKNIKITQWGKFPTGDLILMTGGYLIKRLINFSLSNQLAYYLNLFQFS